MCLMHKIFFTGTTAHMCYYLGSSSGCSMHKWLFDISLYISSIPMSGDAAAAAESRIVCTSTTLQLWLKSCFYVSGTRKLNKWIEESMWIVMVSSLKNLKLREDRAGKMSKRSVCGQILELTQVVWYQCSQVRILWVLAYATWYAATQACGHAIIIRHCNTKQQGNY